MNYYLFSFSVTRHTYAVVLESYVCHIPTYVW